jgi:hypothetical protein
LITTYFAAVRRYAEVNQPKVTASKRELPLISERVTVSEETVQGTRKDASEATINRIDFFSVPLMGRSVVRIQGL